MGKIIEVKCPYCEHVLRIHTRIELRYIEAEPKEWKVFKERGGKIDRDTCE